MGRRNSAIDTAVASVEESATQAPQVSDNQHAATGIAFPTGSTLLNLALSNDHNGGFDAGKVVSIIGDSSAGKSILVDTVLAEACRLERFDEYALVHDDAEAAMAFDMSHLFGNKMAARTQVLSYDTDPVASNIIDDFKLNMGRAMRNGPVVWALDSWDAVMSAEEKKAYETALDGKDPKGSMGAEKAKAAHELFRNLCRDIRATKSLLMVLFQTKDRMGGGFGGKTKSGCNAPTFFSTHELWMKLRERIIKRDREIGRRILVQVRKNKILGPPRECYVDIYPSVGIDDIGPSIDFLLAMGHWKSGGTTPKTVNPPKNKVVVSDVAKLSAPEFNFVGQKGRLIKEIDAHPAKYAKLCRIVAKVWNELEQDIRIQRTSRYE